MSVVNVVNRVRRLRGRLALAAALAGAVTIGVLQWQSATVPTDGPPVPAAGGRSRHFTVLEQPVPAPAATFADAEGKQHSLGEFSGRVVLVNFWATWCTPCIKEMPALQRLQAARGGPEFQVITISIDRGGVEAVRPFLDKQGIVGLPVYYDPRGEAGSAFAARGLPTTVLIDRQGREVGRYEGAAEWDGAEALAWIERAGSPRG